MLRSNANFKTIILPFFVFVIPFSLVARTEARQEGPRGEIVRGTLSGILKGVIVAGMVLDGLTGQGVCLAQSELEDQAKPPGEQVQARQESATGDEDRNPVTPEDLSGAVAGFTPKGWEIFDEVKLFTPESLYEQINGRAEFFLAYDVVSMTLASFVNERDVGQFIDLSVYDMGSAINAFGVFSVERSGEESSLELGRAGYRLDANYYVWKGRYYITIIASHGTEEFQDLGKELAGRMTDYLPDSNDPIWGFTALPQENQVPHSVQYFKVDAMGLEFMRNTFVAGYRKQGRKVTVFLSRRDSAEAAEAAVGNYAEYAKEYGKGAEHVNVNDIELTTCNMGGVYDVIFRRGRLMGGVWSVADRGLAIQAAVELYGGLGREVGDLGGER
jgi:hypothetical protein